MLPLYTDYKIMSIPFLKYVKYSGALHNPNKSDLCKVMRMQTLCGKACL